MVKFAETKKIRSDAFPSEGTMKDHWMAPSSSAPRGGLQYHEQTFPTELMSNLVSVSVSFSNVNCNHPLCQNHGFRGNPAILMSPQQAQESIHYGTEMVS